jgi:LmbE family N-acetylglucosaminyl deacetylase
MIRALAVAASLGFAALQARAQTPGALKAVTDMTTYDVGSTVRLKVFPSASGAPQGGSMEILATVRYAGQNASATALASVTLEVAAAGRAEYRELWRIPETAATGRYEVDLEERDPQSQQTVATQPRAASFAVHRKLVEIERIELGKTFYTSGDAVGVSVTLKNLTGHPMTGVRVEFSNRYWPWIAGPADQAKASIVPLATNLTLPPGGEVTVGSEHAAVAEEVKQPSIHQYGVVVWDAARANAYDIGFSRLTFIQPPGVDTPRRYPGQYIYPSLDAVNVHSYRHFYPPALDSPVIEFDHSHTLYPPGGAASVSFSLQNPGPEPWRGVSVRATLVGPDGAELKGEDVAGSLDLDPGKAAVQERAEFSLPSAPAGIYDVRVEVADSGGRPLARRSLELGVNPLPASLMIFCAHEDDEGGWDGMIRAAVENHIPIHFVYFTSGDAGSCDRYFERSCGPEEALAFGALRMDETRAVLGHLGVPRDDILFLGLPDGGSGEIWYHHVAATNPYLATLLASDHAPYEGLAEPNLPYARDSVVEEAEALIRKFQPAVIVTAHPPSVGHIDHIVNNYFVVKALQQLLRQGAVSPDVELLVDRVYDPKAQPSTPYHYAERTLYVSREAAALAQEAEWFYQSQGANHAEGNLRDFDQLPTAVRYRAVLDWKEHGGWNELSPRP